MAECVYRVVLDGREQPCRSSAPGHTVHEYQRTQGRLRVEFVDLANGVQADAVPASETSACVSDAGHQPKGSHG